MCIASWLTTFFFLFYCDFSADPSKSALTASFLAGRVLGTVLPYPIFTAAVWHARRRMLFQLFIRWRCGIWLIFLDFSFGSPQRVTFLTPDFTSACAHVLLTTASEMLTVCHENHKEAVTFLTQQPIWLHHQLTSKFDLHQCILQVNFTPVFFFFYSLAGRRNAC